MDKPGQLKKTLKLLAITSLVILATISCRPGLPPATPPQPIQPPIPYPLPEPPPDTIAPETIITSSPDGTVNQNTITFQWTGTDDKTPTANLTYSCYLAGHDTDYSPFTSDTTKTYSSLPDGTYTFYVKSRDDAGNEDKTPASVEFTIHTIKPSPVTPIAPADSSLLIVPNSNVSHIAAGCDGKTIYAIDSFNAKLYKSEQGGFGWADSSRSIGGASTWDGLAVAPDDARVLAIVTDSGTEVYLSTNGGTNFYRTGLTGALKASERVKCLALSPVYGQGRRELVVGTSTGNGGGRVLLNISSGAGIAWTDISTSVSGWLPGSPPIAGTDVFAIEYSPSFPADGTLLAIVASKPPPDTDDTYLYIGLRDLGTGNIVWNSSPGYPVEICQQGSDTPGTPLTYADLALPADYNGANTTHRHVYACWTDNPAGSASAGNPNDDVYRLDDTVVYRLLVRNDITCSLAHYGRFNRGKLLAGALNARAGTFAQGPQVYCSFNPQSAYPTWQESRKPPTGPGRARVAWSPDGNIAYCGTSSTAPGGHDQSAFSLSRDNGLTWNQTGLIDL
ncbi:MAG: hypothetical protein FJ024_01245 [Chloroflexi bacterium]|nr:hypothetical protein [Chloroflexota bacterium]